MNDLSEKQALSQSWNNNAEAWVEAVHSGNIESRRVTDRAVLDAVLAKAPKRVLDLGCGEGWLVRALVERGIEAVGVDGTEALIDSARKAGPGRFYLSSYSDLVHQPEAVGRDYDMVVANFALLEEDISPLLRAMHPLLSAGGSLVVQTLHPWSMAGEYRDGWRLEEFAGIKGEWQPMPWYFRTLSSWAFVLNQSVYRITALQEPALSSGTAPVSLLMVAEPQPSGC